METYIDQVIAYKDWLLWAAIAYAATFILKPIRSALKKHGPALILLCQLWRAGAAADKIRLSPQPIPDQNGWFIKENACNALYWKVHVAYRFDSNRFDNAKDYMAKAGDEGRKPLSIRGWALLGALMLAESTLVGMTIFDIGLGSVTPAQKPFFAGLIGAVFSSLMMLVDHVAGKEWRRNEVIQRAGASGREGLQYQQASTASINAVETRTSIENTRHDDHEPPWVQAAARLDTNHGLSPDWRWFKGTLVFTGIVMTLIFIARLCVAEVDLGILFSGDNMANIDPGDQVAAMIGAMDSGADASEKWDVVGTLAVQALLAFIFAGIQAIAIYISREYGFVGKASPEAHKVVKEFQSREEYLNHHQKHLAAIDAAAQARLGRLQHDIIERVMAQGIDPRAHEATRRASERTFQAYIKLQEKEENSHV